MKVSTLKAVMQKRENNRNKVILKRKKVRGIGRKEKRKK